MHLLAIWGLQWRLGFPTDDNPRNLNNQHALPPAVAPDRLAGGVWERGTCEQVSSLDAEKTVPSTDSLMSDCWCFVLCKECGRSSPPLEQHDGGSKEEADHQVDVSDGIRLVPDKAEAKAEATAAAPARSLQSVAFCVIWHSFRLLDFGIHHNSGFAKRFPKLHS
ncbi:hypothetical protein ACRRTK_013006 [Alexandromys fortis]